MRTLARLNQELRARLELRSAELALGAADLAIRGAAGLEQLRAQHQLDEARLRAALETREHAHARELQSLAENFAQQHRLQEDMFRQRCKKLAAEARKARPQPQAEPQAETAPPHKLPLEQFLQKHLLQTFADPGFAHKPLAPPDTPQAANNSFLENRTLAVCAGESHKSSLHFAKRLQALEARLGPRSAPLTRDDAVRERSQNKDAHRQPRLAAVCATQPLLQARARPENSPRDAGLDRSAPRPAPQEAKQPAPLPRPQSSQGSKKPSLDSQALKATPDTGLGSQKTKHLRLDVPPAELPGPDLFADSRDPRRPAQEQAQGQTQAQAQARRLNFSGLERSGEPADSPSSFQLDLDDCELEARLSSRASSPRYSRVLREIESMIQRVGPGR